MNDFIPVNEPLLNGNEKKYLLECIDTGWISSEGPFIQRFEEKMANTVGRKYGIAVSNGTAALEIAVQALGIGAGDEVIIPTFTIISCASAVVKAGATPVFVDCDLDTWNMSVSKIEEKISKKTKAIMVVHIYGLPTDMNSILALAEKYNLKIIEDAAEMHGQTYEWKPCGSFGDISIFSFYPNKHITTGEGGMILTDDKQIDEKCRSLRNLCFNSKRRFIHDELGHNYRMTNMQAALGVAQLEQLDTFVEKKRAMGKLYTELLSDVPGLQLPVIETAYAQNIYWVFGIVLKDDVPFETEEIMKKLADENIGTRPFFWPMHEQPVFKKMGFLTNEALPNAEKIARRGFYIPSGLNLSEQQIHDVANAVRTVMLEAIRK
ncbi:aminotransferase DegT [Lysinibacillus sp. KCTC 33748]|uniref:DegT/DnrJ/EryC1/StrS family aminotransferase n=1 Tax=unclassified Lysinibacillus TaxID=2636778 RepID=UPI0009A68F01|nr:MULTISPECIES: DegT/DnrJ/EryC1/StrS family aminotransferase [unclassified Lysinibacillus]OXS77037.1 aminotransferase DegT [Lysinibacillus sp. KCTC 33748]SKB29103.1 perosamine synthetase [Lysinibacillus sp. AC-3]